MNSYEHARQALGSRLRDLRRGAGFSGKQLAEALGWSASKVSKIEHGRQTPSEADLADWARSIGRPEAIEELRNQLCALEGLYTAWRRQLRTGTRARQQANLDLEAGTRLVRALETAVVPGLLQTAEYARRILTGIVEFHGVPGTDIAEGVRIRMERQHALYDPERQFHFLLTESAIRQTLVPADVMRGQVDRLLALSSMGNIRLGVLPLKASPPFAISHGFWLFDNRVALVETFAAELTIEDEQEIGTYAAVFERLAPLALYGEGARELLSRILDDLPQGNVSNSHSL